MRKKRNLPNRILAVMLSVLLAGGSLQGSSLEVRASDHSHSGWTAWSNAGAMPSTAGNYYLTTDVSLSGTTWTVPSGTTNLCLNSHTIRQNNTKRVIIVPSGATFNLYDEGDRGKITGGKASDDCGGGIKVEGTCTMNGGQVTGNTVDCGRYMGNGGAGIAVSGGRFTMKGGSICNNNFGDADGFHGGGIAVNENGTADMTGGKITGNRTKCSGGGVYIESGSSFTMSGGEISGNTAEDSGGGVNVDGTFTMDGGDIKGNTAETTGAGGGGGIGNWGTVILNGGTVSENTACKGSGVLHDSGTKLTLSGSPVINGNKNTDSAADNLYLTSSKLITIGSEGLKSGAHIGIKTAKTPSSCSSGVQLTGNCIDYSKYFVSDVAAYGIGYNQSKIQLMVQHNYAYSSNGATITHKCKKCGAVNTATLSIPGSASRTYTGGAITPVTVTYSAGWVGDKPEVTYTNNINIGTATASLTVGGVTASLNFDITSAEMSGVSASGYEGTYDGKGHGITVTAPEKATVKYGTSSGSYTGNASPTYKNVGNYTVYYQVTKPNYADKTGSAQVNISAKSLTDSMVSVAAGPHVYTGKAITPAVKVTDGSTTLAKDTDYTVSCTANVNKGNNAKVTVTGKGNYAGTINKTFTITAKPLTEGMVTINPSSYVYTGKAITPVVKVIDGSTTLAKDTDYTVSCTANVNKGNNAKVTITGKGNYAGTINKTFTITAKPLTEGMVTINPGSYVYTGKAITPAVKVTDGSTTLAKDTDYTVSCTANVNKGNNAKVTVTGKGNYSGSINKIFQITARSIDDAEVTLDSTGLTYNGSDQEKGVGSVIVNGMKLTAGTDYDVTENTGTAAGTNHKLTIKGKGNYTGTKTKYFTIARKPLAADMITIDSGPHYYTGSAVMPAVTVTDSDIPQDLVKDRDYSVSYADNVNQGTAKVTVTGQGNYTGTIDNLTFTIEYRALPEDKSLANYVTISPESTDGWYNADISLTPEEGCEAGNTPEDMGTGAVTISQETGTEGITETIYVKDSDGNIYPMEFFYKLDKTPPVIDLAAMDVENGTKSLWDWIIGKKSMMIKIPVSDITDTPSGIAEVSYTAESENGTVQTGILQPQGDYYEIALNAEFSGTIQLTAKDNAGNTTQASLTADGGKVIAEDNAPVVAFTFLDGLEPSGDGWYNTAVTVTVNVTDDKDSGNAAIFSSGIAGIRWKEGEDGEEQTVTELPGTAPVYEKGFTISVDTDGTHTYYVNVADNAGNESGWQTVTVKVDTENPVFIADPVVTNPTTEGADVTVTPSEGGKVYWIISDAGTEPDAQEVKEQSGQKGGIRDVTGGTEGSFTMTGLTPGEKHTVYVVLEDVAGNLSEVKKESFFTMPKTPEISLVQLNPDYINEMVRLLETIGNVEVYTDPEHPESSAVIPNGDGSLPVTPGTAIYIRYPERTEDGMTVPASDKTAIQIPGRPVLAEKQVTVTDNAVTVTNPDSKEEYVLVKKGETPGWGDVNTTGEFTGLDVDTEYDLYVRIKATENNFISMPVKLEIRTKDHTMQKTEAKAPTCTEAGNREYWTCSDCHKLFGDGQGKTETDSSEVTIPAAGHTFPEQWTVEKEATESESGRQYKICETETCGIKTYQTIDPAGTPVDPYAGKIEKEVNVLPGAPDTVLNNSKEELVESILTKDEIKEIDSGAADAKIWLEIASDVEIAEDKKVQVQKEAEQSVGAGAEVTYFDASLFKQVGNREKTPIHEPGIPISVTIVIPEDIRNKDVLMARNYQIIRLHEGETDIIEGTYNEESAEFTFKTDKFSIYAICYKGIPKQAEPGTPTSAPGGTAEPGTPTSAPGGTAEPGTPTSAPGGTAEPGMPTPVPEESTKPGTPTPVPGESTKPGTPTSAPDESGQTGNEIEKRKDLSILLATGKQKGSNGIKLTWLKWKGASGYEVYWSYCDGKKNYKKLKTVKAKCTYTHKKLKKDHAYKYYIAAYQMVDGKKKYVAKSPNIHVAMKYEKRTNAKKIAVNKANAVLSLADKEYKKTFQVRVKVTKENSKKKLLTHAAGLRYYTDDKKVARVSRTGKITARGRGTCTVYVIANNGVCRKIRVTVR